MLTLILNSCASGNQNNEARQDTLNKVVNEQSQTNVNSKQEMIKSNFLSFWKEFTQVVKSSNLKLFKAMSLDSLDYENKRVHVDTFITVYFSKVFDDTLKSRFIDKGKVEFIDAEIDPNYLPQFIVPQAKEGKFIIRKVNITKVGKYSEGLLIIVLEFIETKKGYKFYRYDKFG